MLNLWKNCNKKGALEVKEEREEEGKFAYKTITILTVKLQIFQHKSFIY